VYKEALAIEFEIRDIPFKKEKVLKISYKDRTLKNTFQADFVCYGKIVVETKALSQLISDHESQVLNYLKAANFKLGILINLAKKVLYTNDWPIRSANYANYTNYKNYNDL